MKTHTTTETQSIFAVMNQDELALVCLDLIGYDPFALDAFVSVDEIRQLLTEYASLPEIGFTHWE